MKNRATLALILVTLVSSACTKLTPATSDAGSRSCSYDGNTYPYGATFSSSDGCNTCSCGSDGLVACTARACVDSGVVSGLSWYQTCGAPVCGTQFDGPTGAALCTHESVGESCSSDGALCDPSLGCAVNLVCAKSDPTMQVGGCPISRARYKDEIRYLNDQELARVATQLLATPLAHWRYKHSNSDKDQMGFIIEDVEPSPSVEGDHVNLYGYTSMAVATLKVQAEQLAALERELQQMRKHMRQLERRCTDARASDAK